MKTKIQNLFIAAAFAGLVQSAKAQVNYAISGSTAYVSNSPSASGNVVIASTYEGYPVTSIGNNAFDLCSALKSVTIPNGVTNIGGDAFSFCTGLTNVTIPNSVISIGDYAFDICSALTSVTIPNGLTSIGVWTFGQCSGLKSVTIPNGVTNIGDYAFYYDSGLTNVTIPSSVTSIGGDAFGICSALTSVTIPNGITSIGGGTFEECYGLTSVTIPNNVTNIGDEAFYSCTGLKSVTIPNNVISIGQETFHDCTSLTNIVIGGGVTSIGVNAFDHCTALTSVSIPNNVTSIIGETFQDCSSLTNIGVDAANPTYASMGGVLFNKAASMLLEYPEGLKGSYTIPNSVTNIGYEAFLDCIHLTSVTISDSVTGIGVEAFYDCTGLTNVVIGNSVTSIGLEAFDSCYRLTDVTIPGSVTNIGELVFAGCTSLTNFNVDAENAFLSSTNGVLFDKNQTTLILFPCGLGGSYAIPNGVTNIGTEAFFESRVTSVTIPDSVTSIGTSAFGYCSSLADVVIGSGITNISNTYLFTGCGNLTSVTFPSNAPTADSSIFNGDNLSKITVYYAPGTTGWAAFASATGVSVAPSFGSTTYGGLPVIFYPTNGVSKTLQMSTNPASGNWVTVSNAVTLASLELTNPPPAGFFRLQSSGGTPPNPGLVIYFNLPVLFYPTNAAYSLLMSTDLAASSWSAPSGSAFIVVQVTNAPAGAVFRLY